MLTRRNSAHRTIVPNGRLTPSGLRQLVGLLHGHRRCALRHEAAGSARYRGSMATHPQPRPAAAPRAGPDRLPSTRRSSSVLGREPNPLETGALQRDVVASTARTSPRGSTSSACPPRARTVLVGPGRERRRRRRRRRHRGRHPHREPQPPLGHRAPPGRGDRRGRDPARHLHHGRPPAGRHGPALLRRARRRPPALAGRGRGRRASRATATRSACRRSAAS